MPDRAKSNIQRYSKNISDSAFNNDEDIPHQRQVRNLINESISNQEITYRYLIWGERNGTINNNELFAFGNGANAPIALIIPRNSRLTKLGLASSGTVSNLELAFQVNGSDIINFTFNSNGVSPEIDLPIAAGSEITFIVRGGQATGNNRVFAEISVDYTVDGIKGEKGDKGEDGVTFNDQRFGSGVPANTLGNDGDIYIDRLTGDLYHKFEGVWTFQLNLRLDTGTVEGKNGFVIYAEQNDALGGNGGEEWSFGNGAEVSGNAVVIPVDCELSKLAFQTTDNGIGSEVEVLRNGTATGASVIFTGGKRVLLTLTTPISFNEGDWLSFRTVSAGSINAAASTVTAYFESTILGLKGEKGDRGEKGANGDLSWQGQWLTTRTYEINEAFFFNGSSYITIATTLLGENPSNAPNKFDLLVQAPTSAAVSLIELIKTNNQSSGNSPALTTVLFENEAVPSTNLSDLEKSGNGVLCKKNGIVEASTNIGIFTNVQRANLRVYIQRTRGAVTSLFGVAKSFYVRSASNHNESSGYLMRPMPVESGDILTVVVTQEANGGTVNLLSNECNLYVKYL